VTAGSIAPRPAALSYLDFRFADRPWRDARPRLAAFYEAFAKRPSMQATNELANPTWTVTIPGTSRDGLQCATPCHVM
jgi:hypothetical protein